VLFMSYFISCTASLLSLATLAVERYLAIRWGQRNLLYQSTANLRTLEKNHYPTDGQDSYSFVRLNFKNLSIIKISKTNTK
jgi:hypothetical protein